MEDPTSAERMVSIETLEYGPAQALDRARSLRQPLEEAIASGRPTGRILDELFDLIRLAAK